MALYDDETWIKLLVFQAIDNEIHLLKSIYTLKGLAYENATLLTELEEVKKCLKEDESVICTVTVLDMFARIQQDARIPFELFYKIIKAYPHFES